MEDIKRKNRTYSIIAYIIILTGLMLIATGYYIEYKNQKLEEDSLQFFEQEQFPNEIIIEEVEDEVKEKPTEIKTNYINYIASITIRKINLERGLVEMTSPLNHVDKNIEILVESDMPDRVGGNFILAAHSGSGSTAYFKNLYKLELEDEIMIKYNQSTYYYKVINKYEIEKTGEAHILRNLNEDTLTLITCVSGTENQLIIIAEKTNY